MSSADTDARGLDAREITLRLGTFALRGASLSAAPGKALVLLGPNGAGKSVCLEAIAGFHRLARGNIRIAGRDVTTLPPEQRRVGFVVQNFGLFPHLSVAENVALGGHARRHDLDIAAMLDRFGIAHLAASRPTYLSPGEKQRAALARALASRPDLFLFDEPFAALDASTALALRDELARFLRETGLPAIFVTHDHAEARALADEIAIIEAGTIRQSGRTADVFDRPASLSIARFLGIENLLEGRIVHSGRERVRISLGTGIMEITRSDPSLSVGQTVTLCLRAEKIHLLPPQSPARTGAIAARVVVLNPLGPLWKLTLDAGFPLIAYALPQTIEACRLTPGSQVDAAIDPGAVHVLGSSPDQAPAAAL